jgi:hypothetical protein
MQKVPKLGPRSSTVKNEFSDHFPIKVVTYPESSIADVVISFTASGSPPEEKPSIEQELAFFGVFFIIILL